MNKGSEFYWSKYHEQDYIEQYRNKITLRYLFSGNRSAPLTCVPCEYVVKYILQ